MGADDYYNQHHHFRLNRDPTSSLISLRESLTLNLNVPVPYTFSPPMAPHCLPVLFFLSPSRSSSEPSSLLLLDLCTGCSLF